ncbi:protein TabA-like [Ylistrum balloti]|uniref:protein TabA-like n=1 Tax=Ylistrum balloti TaxID=509963 RepID=UPI002905A2B6|nr:protein TabA-like [Ylistrum balloti]
MENPKKAIPYSSAFIKELLNTYGSPLYIYDKKNITENAQELYNAFSWHTKFKNYFAVKATPTAKLLSHLHSIGMNMDCSSYAELTLVEKLGFKGDALFFSSNNTPRKDMKKALELEAIINLDDISLLDFLIDTAKDKEFPKTLSFRFNPGPLKEGNVFIGKPEEAKYGLTYEQLFPAFQKAQTIGVQKFGLHTMVASNELNPYYFVENAKLLFSVAVEIQKKLNVNIDIINLGGGIGIPYMPGQEKVDYNIISQGTQKAYKEQLSPAGLNPAIYMENGRVITGPYGYLLSTVLHKKAIYKDYVGLDACMSQLMRPGMYGAYHEITVLEKEELPKDKTYDVVGGLCENNDKFAIDRALPTIEVGDIVIIHDVGAHGHAMGFNYNGKLRCAEVLIHEDMQHELIRRAETVEDYLRTSIF